MTLSVDCAADKTLQFIRPVLQFSPPHYLSGFLTYSYTIVWLSLATFNVQATINTPVVLKPPTHIVTSTLVSGFLHAESHIAKYCNDVGSQKCIFVRNANSVIVLCIYLQEYEAEFWKCIIIVTALVLSICASDYMLPPIPVSAANTFLSLREAVSLKSLW